MADVASATNIVNGDLGNILNFLSAAAGLGTAATGLVDASKAFCGGPSNFGFGYIKTAIEPFLVRAPGAATAFGNAEVLQTLKANWLNGVAKADQKAKAKALIHLGLTQGNATALATAAGVNPVTLGSLAQKVSAGIAPTQQRSTSSASSMRSSARCSMRPTSAPIRNIETHPRVWRQWWRLCWV